MENCIIKTVNCEGGRARKTLSVGTKEEGRKRENEAGRRKGVRKRRWRNRRTEAKRVENKQESGRMREDGNDSRGGGMEEVSKELRYRTQEEEEGRLS